MPREIEHGEKRKGLAAAAVRSIQHHGAFIVLIKKIIITGIKMRIRIVVLLLRSAGGGRWGIKDVV